MKRTLVIIGEKYRRKDIMSEDLTRARTKDLLNEVKEIEDITKSLRVIVDKLPSSSVKDAFELSVVNLEKKLEKFLSISEPLTEEQKKAIALIKSGKIEISKIFALMESDGITKQGAPASKKKGSK